MFTTNLKRRSLLTAILAMMLFIFGFTFQPIAQINFSFSTLSGTTGLDGPTTLQFGPDGKLYVGTEQGKILIYTVSQTGPTSYTVASTQTISLVAQIPNHNDDGSLYTGVTNVRQVTGILVVGTSTNPIIYVSSSDPRVGGGGSAGDVNLDTNSGIISKLTWNGNSWEKVDLVRGLPRSEENHAVNGMTIDKNTGQMYLAVGGNTNGGAPSNNFAYLNETALSGAILKIDLNYISTLTVKGAGNNKYVYDIPTLNDPTRPDIANPDYDPAVIGSPQTIDQGDPFGGNDGRNQAKLIPNGPVQVYSPGYRNPYDVVISRVPGREGRMYTIDNGANFGWGGYPKNVNTTNISNEYVVGEPGSTSSAGPGLPVVNNLDNMHLVSMPGMAPIYGGQPNPIRANPAGAGLSWNDGSIANFSLTPTVDWPPVPLSMADPREKDLLVPGAGDGALTTFSTSTNGITEYTSSNYFGGQMAGDILAADFSGIIWRMVMNDDGTHVISKEIFASGFGEITLDVVAQGTGEVFEGTIWTCDYTAGKIYVFTPQGSVNCSGNNTSTTLDDDEDGFSNKDEVDNGTNPCNASSFPPDFDGDGISNLNDPDDDNDGILDINDFFHRDAQNGQGSATTILYPFLNGNPGTGLYGLGLTGLMSNGTNPDALYNPNNDGFIMGGAVGLVSFPADQGTAVSNTQKNAFQFGYKVNSSSPTFSVQSSLIGPFFNAVDHSQLNANHRQGIYIGTGDQDNYLMVALSGETGGTAEGIRIVMESGGTVTKNTFFSIPNILSVNNVYLQMDVNPATGVVTVKYSTNVNTTPVTLGTPISLTGTLLSTLQGPSAIAIGLIASSGTATPYSAKWDYMNILTAAPAVANPVADLQTTINGGSQLLDLSNVFTDDKGNSNLTLSIGSNSNPGLVAASINGTALTLIFASQDTGSAIIRIRATDSDGFFVEDEVKVSVVMPPPTTSILINAGGSLETFGSETWIEDQYFTGGSAYTKVTPIDNTTKDAVYQSERWGDFSYAIPVPIGTYTVKLHFADFFYSEINKRKFNVVVENGQGALNNYDIVAKAGGGSKAVVETMNNISVADGVLNISFVSLVDYAKLSGIEIISVSGGGVNTPPLVSNPIPDQQVQVNTPSITMSVAKVFTDNNGPSNLVLSVSGNSNTGLVTNATITNNFLKLKFAPGATGTANLKIKATDAGGLFIEQQFKVDVLGSIPTPSTHILINSGGSALTFEGKTWIADKYFVGGSTYQNGHAIANTNNDAMHQDERTENFSYAIPVPNGIYGVRLHFAELFWEQANKRLMTINVENNQGALSNYDVFAQAGGSYTAVVEEFHNILVNDGVMNISFASVLDNAKVSGIEVFSQPGSVNTEPEVVNPIPTQNVYKNTPSKTINIANVFTDNNGANQLTFTVSENSNTALITSATITGTNLVMNFAHDATGEAIVRVKATDAQGLFVEDEFQVKVQAQQTLTSLKMGAGSAGFSFRGQTWSNDLFFEGGWIYSDTFSVVTNSANKKLYQYERDGNIKYHIPVIPGLYTVKLHFADLYWTQPGQRVFRLDVEAGKYVWENFDIVAKAGGINKAYIEVIDSVDLADGFFDFQLQTIIDNPKISGIEIIPYTGSVNVAPELLVPIPDQQVLVNASVIKIPVNGTFSDDKGVPDLYREIVSNTNTNLLSAEVINDTLRITVKPNQTGTSVLKFRATDAQGLWVEDEFEVKVLLTAPPTTIRINAGGTAQTFGSDTWVADQYFVGGYVNTNTNDVANSTIDPIYQSERWDNHAYNIPVINGTYSVKLHFSESNYTAAGSRKFNVNIENNQGGLNNYDIFAKAGGANKAIIETFNNILISDGTLNINFVNVVGNAKVCGIEILPYSASNSAPTVTNTIPDQAISYNTVSKQISLATTFNDNNGIANLSLTVTGNTNTAVVTSATLNGSNLILLFGANQSGTTKIKIRATDAQGLFVEDEFNVTVYPDGPLPVAPVINNAIPDQTVNLGTVNKVISLVNVFSDDEGDANMTYSVNGNTNTTLVTSASVNGTNLTLTFAPGMTGTATIRIRATDSDALFAEDEFKIDVSDIPATTIRIAAGGPGHTFGTEVWSADKNYIGGSTYGSAVAIANTTNDQLYQNERWGNHSYSIPVPNGTYTVKLHFAEIYHTSAGARVFNISIENGQKTLNNYDIFAKAGGGSKAVIETISDVNVSDGNVTIAFTGVTDNAKVSGIEVISAPTNTAPVVTTPIPDQTVNPGTTSKVISLANVFTDNFGPANLTLTVSGNTNTALVTGATISGTNLTLNFGAGLSGNSTIKVKATDAGGLFVEDDFVITVLSNAPPVVSTPIPDQQYAAGTTTKVVGLADVFTDNGGAANLTLSVSGNSNTALITGAVINGTNLTLTLASGVVGSSTIKVKATDAFGLFVEDDFVVTVAANTAPTVVTVIPDVTIAQGATSYVVNVNGHFADDNGAANITYSVPNYSGATLVSSITVNGTNLNLTIVPNVLGTAQIRVRAKDAQGLYVDDIFVFKVVATLPNAAPYVVTPIPDQTVTIGTASKVISLANTFNDDGGAGNIVLSVSGNSNTLLVTSATIAGSNLALNFGAGVSGNATIKVKATDAQGLFVEDAFNVQIDGPNSAPVVTGPIADQVITPGTANKVISLASVFTDNNGIGNLTFTVTGNTNTTLITSATISGTNLTLVFGTGQTGSSTIKVKATDAQGLFAEDEFKVDVKANAAPTVVTVIPDVTIAQGATSYVVNVNGHFADDNGAANITYSVPNYSGATLVSSITVNGTNLNLTIVPNVLGTAQIRVRAKDAQGLYVDDIFVFKVVATLPNAAPYVVTPIPDQTVTIGTASKVISLANTFNDDGGAGNIVLSVSGNSNTLLVTSATIAGGNLTLNFGAGVSGNATIKVKATDAQGLFVEDAFNVQIDGPNSAPVVTGPIADQVITPGTANKVIGLASVFTDNNGIGNLTFTVTGNTNTTLITSATISGTNLTLVFGTGQIGSSTIKVKATDAQGLFAEDEFVVDVKTNAAPTVVTVIPDVTIAQGATSYVVNVNGHFADDNGAANITYSVPNYSGATLVSSITVNGTNLNLTIVPNVLGTAQIRVRAKDAQGLYVDDIFVFKVIAGPPNTNPVVASAIPDQAVTMGTTSKVISLTGVFTDDGGVANLTQTVSGNTNTALVTAASISGSNLTLSFGAGQTGTSTIKVKATDVQGLFAEDEFVVTVTAPLTAPTVVTPIPDQSVTLGTTSKVISLANTFTDEKGAANITLSVTGNTNTALVTGATLNGTNLTLTFATNLTGTANIKVKALDSDNLFVEDEFKVDVISTTPTTLIRIAAGGAGHTFGSEVWGADQYFSGGNAYGESTAIANTTNDILYQNERWGNTTYSIPVPNGLYTVKLHFAEIFFTATGQRIFNVNVENGQGALNNYDIVSKAGGGATAVVEQFTNINVADGNMTISLTGVTDNAKISGIEVISNATGGGSRVMLNSTIDVKASNDIVEVNWTSGDRTDGEYTIERSADGKLFESLQTTVVSKNDKKSLIRRYADMTPLNGVSYYRIKRGAKDGAAVSYSPVKQVTLATNHHSFLVYPNPNNTGVLFLEFPKELGMQENLKIRVLSLQGAVLYQQTQTERAGILLKLNLPGTIANGAYIVEIEKNGKRHHSRFILNR